MIYEREGQEEIKRKEPTTSSILTLFPAKDKRFTRGPTTQVCVTMGIFYS